MADGGLDGSLETALLLDLEGPLFPSSKKINWKKLVKNATKAF